MCILKEIEKPRFVHERFVMYTKKVIFICCNLMLPLPLMASHPGGKYYGNCQRAVPKKYQYGCPDQSYQKKQCLYERMMAKRMAPVQEATHAATLTLFNHYELPVADMPSMYEHQAASCHLYRSGNAHPCLAFAFLSLLLLAPYAHAAQVEQGPQGDAPHQLRPAFTLAEQIRYMQAKDASTLASLTLDGHIQPVADYVDGFADTLQTFGQDHDGLASVVIPGAIISLKSLYGAIIGAAKTNSFAGAGAYAAIAAIRASIDEVKSIVACEFLEDIIDQVVQHGIEHIAPKLMKFDNTLKQESAERLATWIAAGVLLNGYEFRRFGKHMRATDFKALSARAHLYKLATAKVTFSDLTHMPIKSVFSGTPHATTEILVRSSLLGSPNIPTSGVGGSSFPQLIQNAGLTIQPSIPTSNWAGNANPGNPVQQMIENAGLYARPSFSTSNGVGNGNSYSGSGYGNSYQGFMQTPGRSSSGHSYHQPMELSISPSGGRYAGGYSSGNRQVVVSSSSGSKIH